MNEEEYKTKIENIRTQLDQKKDQVLNLTNDFNTERTNLQKQISDSNLQIQDNKREIDNINNSFKNERNQFDNRITIIQTEKQQAATEFQNKINKLEQEVNNLSKTIISKDKEVVDLKQEIEQKDENIINKLSKSYGEQSEKYIKKVDEWNTRVNTAFGFLLFSVSISIAFYVFGDLFKSSFTWDKKIVVFSLDILAISFLWFAISQYSYYSKIVTDYINRKTVSESFLSFIHGINDHQLREKASEKISNTLFSRSTVDMGNELPIKEGVKLAKIALESVRDIVR